MRNIQQTNLEPNSKHLDQKIIYEIYYADNLTRDLCNQPVSMCNLDRYTTRGHEIEQYFNTALFWIFTSIVNS